MSEVTTESSDEIYVPSSGMPLSVFNDRYSRKHRSEDRLETFEERITGMVEGNFSLTSIDHRAEGNPGDKEKMLALALKGVLPMSGRHIQHGDFTQPNKNMEVFTNCSTTPFSFMLMLLLLNGSGVGRDYSSESCRVNWDFMPNIRVVLNGGPKDDGDIDKGAHPDFKEAALEFTGGFDSLRDATHKYDSESEDVRWIKVRDSREGWSEVIAILETAAFHKNHSNSLFIFDFSDVRCRGSKIKGMQDRIAQGPIPLMRALLKVASIKGAGMRPWKQAMFIDHYLADCVVMGNVRRAARMSTKFWKDRDILEFIEIKRGGYLHTSNNSVIVDEEFWAEASDPRPSHGRRVFEAVVGSAYFDRTGEPGFINAHLLKNNMEGADKITAENYLSDVTGIRLHPKTYEMIEKTISVLMKSKHPFITNPCQPGWAPILTPSGIRPLDQIEVGTTIWANGKWTKVVDKWSTGIKQVNRYRTTSGVFYGTSNHRVVSDGQKIEAGMAESIDKCIGPKDRTKIIPLAVMDGLVIGDGTRHMASHHKVYLDVGKSDYTHELGDLILADHPAKLGRAKVVKTSIQPDELVPLPERTIPDRYLYGTRDEVASFLRGLFSANGSCNGRRICLKSTSSEMVEQVQVMLSSLGIASYFTTNKPKAVKWQNGTYIGKESYDININAHNGRIFRDLIGFIQPHKTNAMDQMLSGPDRGEGYQKQTFDIVSDEHVSTEEVFDITVEDAEHVYWTGGCLVSNCGEIVLSKWGGYCVIGDICMAKVDSINEFNEACRQAAKFLVRTNLMQSMYKAEVDRTNRIGVGLTGIHEFYWRHFGLTFRDVVSAYDHVFDGRDAPSNPKVMQFWQTLADGRKWVEFSASDLSMRMKRTIPHTFTTIKPSGTISKVMGCTEGAHLPAFRFYMRWVIFPKGGEKHLDFERRGYPVQDVSHEYKGSVVVGFPTKSAICDVMPHEKVVTADEASFREQYQWIRLLEHFWLGEGNNQVSYTMKFNFSNMSYHEFAATILRWQGRIRCCSWMPSLDDIEGAYAYTPEEPITAEQYQMAMDGIKQAEIEGYNEALLECASGACPI